RGRGERHRGRTGRGRGGAARLRCGAGRHGADARGRSGPPAGRAGAGGRRRASRMRRMVKICGLTDAAQVAAAVAAGADALGFVFAESVREVTPGEARAAAAAVPSRVLRVAVMRHPSRARWAEVARVFRPDVLQTDEADFAELEVAPEVQRWPVVREGDYGEHR